MRYFEQDFIDFFNELEANNHKEWFHENKKRYEVSIKQPFELFLTHLIAEIQSHDPELQISPKDCILRINRDVRFSKDKTPYNVHYTAFVSRGGRKDKSIPGIFLRFSPKMIGIMGGCFGPDQGQLASIRHAIAAQTDRFREIINDNGFIDLFGEIQGEQMKRIPKDLQQAIAHEPLIAKKQFYIVNEMSCEMITSDQLMETVMRHWQTMSPFNQFLTQAIS